MGKNDLLIAGGLGIAALLVLSQKDEEKAAGFLPGSSTTSFSLGDFGDSISELAGGVGEMPTAITGQPGIGSFLDNLVEQLNLQNLASQAQFGSLTDAYLALQNQMQAMAESAGAGDITLELPEGWFDKWLPKDTNKPPEVPTVWGDPPPPQWGQENIGVLSHPNRPIINPVTGKDMRYALKAAPGGSTGGWLDNMLGPVKDLFGGGNLSLPDMKIPDANFDLSLPDFDTSLPQFDFGGWSPGTDFIEKMKDFEVPEFKIPDIPDPVSAITDPIESAAIDLMAGTNATVSGSFILGKTSLYAGKKLAPTATKLALVGAKTIVPKAATRAIPVVGWGLLGADLVADASRVFGFNPPSWLGFSPLVEAMSDVAHGQEIVPGAMSPINQFDTANMKMPDYQLPNIVESRTPSAPSREDFSPTIIDSPQQSQPKQYAGATWQEGIANLLRKGNV